MPAPKIMSFTVRIPTELGNALKREAEKRIVSPHYLIRRAIFDWFEANEIPWASPPKNPAQVTIDDVIPNGEEL